MRHFCHLARREHQLTFSYTLVKTALPGAGLVAKHRPRGRHRRRREPRPCFGELLHLDGSKHTQVGRALARLGIEHILGHSPQARGRSERMNGTLQGRLVNELRMAGIRTLDAANRSLRQRFLPTHNATFGRPPANPAA